MASPAGALRLVGRTPASRSGEDLVASSDAGTGELPRREISGSAIVQHRHRSRARSCARICCSDTIAYV